MSATSSIEINRARIHYEEMGSGSPVVLAHNGIGDMRTWDDQFPVFAESCRAIRYDMRGWGRSVCPSGAFSHSRDLAALLQALDAAPACVVGSSFGGLVALDLALESPECVSALVLAGSALGGYRF
ncbi:MAG TPA: alpha/beta hydrolase, partial [Thermomicrobiales bacterium]|nr:alpha/beta hydrolase [Thermomicrobiales bacterium]